MSDVIVEEVRRVREELFKLFGGINDYFQHCQCQDRALKGSRKPRRRKQPLPASRKSTRPRES